MKHRAAAWETTTNCVRLKTPSHPNYAFVPRKPRAVTEKCNSTEPEVRLLGFLRSPYAEPCIWPGTPTELAASNSQGPEDRPLHAARPYKDPLGRMRGARLNEYSLPIRTPSASYTCHMSGRMCIARSLLPRQEAFP
jgi:hypothetical protein